MKILCVSDEELSFIYNPTILERFRDIDMVIGCGDLPNYYLEYIHSMLDVNVYFVRGNHTRGAVPQDPKDFLSRPGAREMHRICHRDTSGLLLAGIEGSLRYNQGLSQYSQVEMWNFVLGLVPQMFLNHISDGRFLDIFITHAPPWGIHDREDLPHQGIKAFRWFNKVFKPKFHVHGHIHLYRKDEISETQFFQTRVLNCYGYKTFEIKARQEGFSIAAREARRVENVG